MEKRSYKKVNIFPKNHSRVTSMGCLLRDNGWVYAVRFGNVVKIGKTKNPQSRMDNLQSGQRRSYHELHLIECDESRIAERILHRIFEKYRVGGEWFRLSNIQMSIISSVKEYKDGKFK